MSTNGTENRDSTQVAPSITMPGTRCSSLCGSAAGRRWWSPPRRVPFRC
jgi:hypothetical protein